VVSSARRRVLAPNAQLFGVNHPAAVHLMKILLQVVAVLLCFAPRNC